MMTVAILLPEGGDAWYARGIQSGMAALGVSCHVTTGLRDVPDSALLLVDGACLTWPELARVRGLAVPLLHRVPGKGLDNVRRLVSSSQAVADMVAAQLGDGAVRLCCVPPGFDPAARARPPPESCARIVTLGDLVPRKRHDLLIGACQLLTDLDWRLAIAGGDTRDPAHAARLRAMTRGDTRITFHPADQAESLLDGAHLFALASRWEATNRALGLALRRGVPALLTRSSPLLRPGAGVLSDPDNLSRALRRLVLNPALRNAMAAEAALAGDALPDWPTQARAMLVACSPG